MLAKTKTIVTNWQMYFFFKNSENIRAIVQGKPEPKFERSRAIGTKIHVIATQMEDGWADGQRTNFDFMKNSL